MKKEYLIGLLTGCLLTASALMFIGATNQQNEVGTYQISVGAAAIYLLNTKTAETYLLRNSDKPKFSKLIPDIYWFKNTGSDPFIK